MRGCWMICRQFLISTKGWFAICIDVEWPGYLWRLKTHWYIKTKHTFDDSHGIFIYRQHLDRTRSVTQFDLDKACSRCKHWIYGNDNNTYCNIIFHVKSVCLWVDECPQSVDRLTSNITERHHTNVHREKSTLKYVTQDRIGGNCVGCWREVSCANYNDHEAGINSVQNALLIE